MAIFANAGKVGPLGIGMARPRNTRRSLQVWGAHATERRSRIGLLLISKDCKVISRCRSRPHGDTTMATTKRLKRRAPAERAHTERGRAHRVRDRSARTTDVAEPLGASRSFAVATRPRGPFGVAALLEEVKNRLVSRGGRPSDPSPTVRRLVPLKRQVWRRLQMQAEHLSGLFPPKLEDCRDILVPPRFLYVAVSHSGPPWRPCVPFWP